MVEIKFIIEVIIVLIAIAVAVYFFINNYQSIANQFWEWLYGIGSLIAPG